MAILYATATDRDLRRVTGKTYSISDLAREFGVTTRTIRFYEEKGLVTPLRQGQKRLYSGADRVRIKLILRGKRIGMTLQECVDFIDMYDPEHNNAEQLQALIEDVKGRREHLLQQKKDIDDMLAGLAEVQALCEASLADSRGRAAAQPLASPDRPPSPDPTTRHRTPR